MLISVIFIGLAACASDFPAPVSDRGEAMEIGRPIIVTNQVSDVYNSLRSKSANSSARNTDKGTYKVRRGDNLISIAFRYDLDFRALAKANQLKPPYTIFVDQELDLETGHSSEKHSIRNNRLGVEAPSNSEARTQADSSIQGTIARESIINETEEQRWKWPSSGIVVKKFLPGLNKGIDIGGQVGDPVYAANKGEVVYSGRDDVQGIGNLLIIRHGDRYLSAYGHNSRMLVAEGDAVISGQKIAEIGSDMDGDPVLHFEVRFDGKPANPLEILPRR